MGSSSSALSDSNTSDNATASSNFTLKNAVIFETGGDNSTGAGNLGLLKTILPFLLVAFSAWWLNTQLRYDSIYT
ncbi:hypothetical protein CHS0354_009183 [Potamilus streckersoni]|uniref:Uncharacterized protein n=1 Tax=Potamilus streckersoni TaxID=2493646 RepID=A0AAE0VMC2_9BIVA|nr:hypothetical protein CHS0354_009183 [Potamilus streckersoni]